ncbi:chemotaxis protein CheX [Psychromonas sp. SR45-3]|uniref:chemotaxis protein CheX n=1 Tax=Psychromonas sp. SR45-3 TaxID=2760930 RepID=UPI0015F9502B|nr:chemotaxis protein CheX [Psychromonas sp. SR45-3]MBB1273952.1 chemotaxis protein CheX [Psychromonas sp. SR45-3]
MNAEFVNPFLSSFINVLKTMAMLDIKPGRPSLKKDTVARGDVSGLIGMVGPTTSGSFSISFEKELALNVFEMMVGEKIEDISADITDMVGEITNMVAGGAKRQLGEKGFEFDMATPIVVTGENHSISHQVNGSKVLMPFKSDKGNAYIEICFTKPN